MFIVNSYSQLEEAVLRQVSELLLCGAIGEQIQACHDSANHEENIKPMHRRTIDAVRRHYDAVDFRGKGDWARLFLRRRKER